MHNEFNTDVYFEEHLSLFEKCKITLKNELQEVCRVFKSCISLGNKILIIGNGGSAADAQHIAAEFTGRFKKNRKPLGAIALTTDTSAITAIGNDYSFNDIFSRQVVALAKPGDILLAISTSGNSGNILNAVDEGKRLGCKIVGLTGYDGGALKNICDNVVIVPCSNTARIQEMHIFIAHLICEYIDNDFE